MDSIDRNFSFCIVYFLVFSKFSLLFNSPFLDSLQNSKSLLYLGDQNWVQYSRYYTGTKVRGKKNSPRAASYTSAIIAPYTIGFHCCKATLLTHVQFVVHQAPTYFTAKSLYFCVYIMASKMSLRRFFSSVDFYQYRFQGLVEALPVQSFASLPDTFTVHRFSQYH